MRDWMPTRSQLGSLRDWLARCPERLTSDDLRASLDEFRAEVEKRRGGKSWVRVFDEIGLTDSVCAACCEDGTCRTDHVELFLRVLTRAKSAAEKEARG
jgi:hypothetical protein